MGNKIFWQHLTAERETLHYLVKLYWPITVVVFKCMFVFFCCVSAIHVFVSLSGDSAVIFGSHRAALYNLYNVALEYLMHLCISATRRSRSDVSQSVSHFMLASILLM